MKLILAASFAVLTTLSASLILKTQQVIKSPSMAATSTSIAQPSPTKMPEPTLTPIKIPAQKPKAVVVKTDCTGPDGVHFQTTQKECDDFNNAWNKPKPEPEQPKPSQSYVLHINPVYTYPTYAPLPTISIPDYTYVPPAPYVPPKPVNVICWTCSSHGGAGTPPWGFSNY